MIRKDFFLFFVMLALILTSDASARLITVTLSDDYKKIEGARAGDIVKIAPGVYRFRVMLKNHGTDQNPIIIRAQDPTKRPVWDLHGKDCHKWPGSYKGGDKGRGAWQIMGSNYIISDLIIRGSHLNSGKMAGESSGIRIRHAKNITIRSCLIEENDNGIVGAGENIVYEFCEIRRNGNVRGDRTHNVYNHGGTITIRFCHIYDPVEGQNLHMRSKNARIEYNLIENGNTYMGDLMTDKNDWVKGKPLKQIMTLIGNLIIEKESPLSDSKVFTMYNNNRYPGISMRINMFYNTFIGNGKNEAMIQITNSGLDYQEAYLYNNVFYGNRKPFRIDIPNQPDRFHVEAKNNWWPEGAYSQYGQFMSGSIFGTHPGFKDAKNKDFRLKTSAQAKNRANATLGEYPLFEYYLDENVEMKYKERLGANDLGAFESTKPN